MNFRFKNGDKVKTNDLYNKYDIPVHGTIINSYEDYYRFDDADIDYTHCYIIYNIKVWGKYTERFNDGWLEIDNDNNFVRTLNKIHLLLILILKKVLK